MLRRVLHWFMAKPHIYDLVQRLVGARYVHEQLAAQVAPVRNAARVLDLGGGTGINRDLWPETSGYICLDLDPVKLQGFREKSSGDFPVLGDATCVPLKTGSVDVVLCAAVSHHIPDERLAPLVSESVRALKVGGRFIFLDAVWDRSRWVGRFMWKYDRGSHPRTTEMLKTLIACHSEIVHWQEFRVLHSYILCVGVKRGEAV